MEREMTMQYYHRDSASRMRAQEMLRQAKEKDEKRDLVVVRIDGNTIRLMPREKAEKYIEEQLKKGEKNGK